MEYVRGFLQFFQFNQLSDIAQFLQFFIAALVFGFGFVVYCINKKALKNAVFFFYTASIFLWLYAFAFADIASQIEIAASWYKLGYLGFIFIPLFAYIFSVVFAESQSQVSFAVLGLLLSLIFSILIFTNGDLFLGSIIEYEGGFLLKRGIIYFLFLCLFAIEALAVLINLAALYHKSASLRLRRITILALLAFIIVFIGMIDFLTHLFYSLTPNRLIGTSASGISSFLIGYSVLHYRSFDIKALMRNTLIYAVLSSMLIVLYIVIFIVSQYIMGKTTTFDLVAQNSVIFFIFLLSFSFLKSKTQQFISNLAYDETKDWNALISAMQNDLGRLRDPASLSEAILKEVHQKLGIKSVSLVVLESNEYLLSVAATTLKKRSIPSALNKNTHKDFISYLTTHKEILDFDGLLLDERYKEIEKTATQLLNVYKAYLLIPLFARDSLEGILFLGLKQEGKPYSADEIYHLSRLIQSLGLTLENAKLYQEIKSVSEVKSNIITITSHQLRTPISAIRWGLDFIIGKGLLEKVDPAISNILRDIYKNNLRAITIINRILDLSEIERKSGARVHLNKVDVVKTMKELIDEIHPLFQMKNIAITTEFAKDELVIEADQTKIASIFSIILENAIKYNKNNGRIAVSIYEVAKLPALSLKGKPKDAHEKRTQVNYVSITVKDTGIGIPEKEQKSLFKKFFRAKNASIVNTDGTGLGLAYAKSLVDLHSGEIGIKSKEKESTEVTVLIPTIFQKGNRNIYIF